MRIIEFRSTPVCEFRYLNAGSGPGSFYEDRLPVNVARVDRLPEGMAALIATSDLQGRERFQDSAGQPLRLLGEVLPEWLVSDVLPRLGIHETGNAGALLAGDFYTVPTLDRRGGTGDVSRVWHAFAECFSWVAGVAGNHDTFGESAQCRPRFSRHIHFLEGDLTEICGMRIAGIGGIIGSTGRPNRRREDDYLAILKTMLERRPDVLLMHEGPDGLLPGQRGVPQIRDLLVAAGTGLVIRGHAHWDAPFVEFGGGLQVLNVDARVVVLTAAEIESMPSRK